ncbi:MAG: hypothetical protein KDE24_25385, partial [Caldilinea sp.]|nr:hypothetical protein [Caldilinea sp.]
MRHKTAFNLLSLFLVLIVVFAVSACAPVSTSQPAEKGAADYKIVLLLPGPINDQSWNATNYAGLEKANATLGTK